MRSSAYIVCPSVLSSSDLKLHQTLEVKNIFKQENIMLQLTFNPGLTLIGFRTTRPCFVSIQLFGLNNVPLFHRSLDVTYIHPLCKVRADAKWNGSTYSRACTYIAQRILPTLETSLNLCEGKRHKIQQVFKSV